MRIVLPRIDRSILFGATYKGKEIRLNSVWSAPDLTDSFTPSGDTRPDHYSPNPHSDEQEYSVILTQIRYCFIKKEKEKSENQIPFSIRGFLLKESKMRIGNGLTLIRNLTRHGFEGQKKRGRHRPNMGALKLVRKQTRNAHIYIYIYCVL